MSSVAKSKFEFDSAFQTKIAALNIRDDKFARRCNGLIDPEYFDVLSEEIVASMGSDYFEKYRMMPQSKSVWKQMLRDAVISKSMRRETAEEVGAKLNELWSVPISDRDFVIGKIAEFAKRQAVQSAYLKGIDLIENGDFDQAETMMKGAFRVGADDEVQDINYWDKDQTEARAKHREDIAMGRLPKNGIETGVKKIDALLYHGGWGRKELSVLMGGAKKGKSMGLGFFAGRSSLLGYNVLYLTLEVSSAIIADREDAFLSDTEMNKLGLSAADVVSKLNDYKNQPTKPGELRIVSFPSGSLTCNTVRRLVERYKHDGIVFDLLVVDYADIMAPDIYTREPTENSKSIWLGLRAIADEENLACLTATQTNREGHKEATAKAEHAAEDFNKIRIADLIISINHTEEERANGQARLYFAGSRNQAGEFAIAIEQNMAKMQFITAVKAVV